MKKSEVRHLLFVRLVYGFATKTHWIRQVVSPNIFSVALTHLHLSGMASSDGPKAARHVFYFDSTREPNAGANRFWCLLSAIKKGETQHQHRGDRASGAPSPRPLRRSSLSALSVSSSVQTTRLRCRRARPAPLTAGPGVTTCRRPRFKATSWRCRRAGPPPPPGAPARGRGRSTGSLRGWGGWGRATGAGAGVGTYQVYEGQKFPAASIGLMRGHVNGLVIAQDGAIGQEDGGAQHLAGHQRHVARCAGAASAAAAAAGCEPARAALPCVCVCVCLLFCVCVCVRARACAAGAGGTASAPAPPSVSPGRGGAGGAALPPRGAGGVGGVVGGGRAGAAGSCRAGGLGALPRRTSSGRRPCRSSPASGGGGVPGGWQVRGRGCAAPGGHECEHGQEVICRAGSPAFSSKEKKKYTASATAGFNRCTVKRCRPYPPASPGLHAGQANTGSSPTPRHRTDHSSLCSSLVCTWQLSGV